MLSSLGNWVSSCWGYGRSNGDGELLTAQDIGKHGYGEFSMASIQANQQNEDSFHIESCPPFGGLFVGIFDGHGGHEASQFIKNHLFSHLTKFVSLMGGVSKTSIGMAFDNTEREFEACVTAAWSTNPHLATVGSCALVGVINDGRLYISNLGDSRAVLGRSSKTNGACTSLQLSTEHNVGIEAIREEMKFLHPDDSNIVSLRHGVWRVRGIIQVSRSIGDMYLKKQEFNQEPLYAKFRLSEPLSRPLLTSKPTILVHELQPDDNFVIFASDGLWDHLTNDEAVDIVSRHPHKGVARKLINLALQKAANKREVRYEDLQKIKKGIRRHFHDDITVVVVFLNQEFIKRSSKIGRVLHMNMMDSHSTASVHAHQDYNIKCSFFLEEMASEFMRTFTGRLTTTQFLKTLKLEGDKQKALHFFIWASRQKFYRHGFESHQRILELWGHKPQFKDFLRLLDHSRNPDFQLTDANFTLLMKGYGWAGMVEYALQTFHNLRVFGSTPNVIHYTCLIDTLVRCNQLDMAMNYFNEMVENGCSPNVFTYNAIIHGLCEANDLKNACKLLDEMKSNDDGSMPNVHTYNTLIHGLCKHGREKQALAMFRAMLEKGCNPNVVTYNTLIQDLCKRGRVHESYYLLEEMAYNGCFPNTVTYTIIIDGLCREDKAGKAYELLRKVEKVCSPDEITYGSLLNGLCKAGKHVETARVLQEMSEKGFHPNFVTYNGLISAFCKAGEFEEAFKIWEIVKEKGNIPYISTYNSIINGLCKAGKTKESLTLFDEMKKYGRAPDVVTYTSLIDGFARKCMFQDAFDMLKEMERAGIEPDAFAYNALINGLCKAEKVLEAHALMDQMVEKGCKPGLITYNTFMDCICRAGKVEKINSLLEEMKANGCRPDIITYRSIYFGLRKAGKMQEASKYKKLAEK